MRSVAQLTPADWRSGFADTNPTLFQDETCIEFVLVDGISRLVLPGANKLGIEESNPTGISLESDPGAAISSLETWKGAPRS
jgi:hypothetical protein